jgi:hypothetical protein
VSAASLAAPPATFQSLPETCELIGTVRASMKASSVVSYWRACSHHAIPAMMAQRTPMATAANSQGRCRRISLQEGLRCVFAD